jgi:DNA-binding transcriptional MocR family regulator
MFHQVRIDGQCQSALIGLAMKPIGTDALLALVGRWSAGRGPLYLLLASRLRQLITDGELPDGTVLPPDRTLASALAIGRSTVVSAYDVLRQEGRVVRTQGSGTRVSVGAFAPRPGGTRNPLFLHLLDVPDDGVHLLTCAAPDELPPELVEAYQTVLHRLTGNPKLGLGIHPAGVPELRLALARHYTERGAPTEPEQILITTGAQQGLALLTRLLVAPGDRVLLEAPTYPGVIELVREASAVVRTVPVGESGVDVDAFTSAIRDRPALAYLTASFQNPTGTVVHDLARRRLARVAAECRVPLIDDEVLVHLGFDDRPAPVAAYASTEDVITVGSLSKVVWGGMRIGWVRAGAGLITRLARLKTIYELGGDLLSQLTAARLMSTVDEIGRARAGLLRQRHDHLRAELGRVLPGWRSDRAHGGQTLWVRLPDVDASAFAQTALRHGVAVMPGSAFDPAGGSREYLRIPFLADPATITNAVERLAEAWRGHATPAHPNALIV